MKGGTVSLFMKGPGVAVGLPEYTRYWVYSNSQRLLGLISTHRSSYYTPDVFPYGDICVLSTTS